MPHVQPAYPHARRACSRFRGGEFAVPAREFALPGREVLGSGPRPTAGPPALRSLRPLAPRSRMSPLRARMFAVPDRMFALPAREFSVPCRIALPGWRASVRLPASGRVARSQALHVLVSGSQLSAGVVTSSGRAPHGRVLTHRNCRCSRLELKPGVPGPFLSVQADSLAPDPCPQRPVRGVRLEHADPAPACGREACFACPATGRAGFDHDRSTVRRSNLTPPSIERRFETWTPDNHHECWSCGVRTGR